MRHMGANFHSQFKNKEVTQLFKRLCSTNQEKSIYELWQKLDDLTKKASKEIAKKPISTEPGEEPVSLEDVGLDALNVRRRRGHAVKTFSQWIQNEPKEKWCLLFDKGGVRHGIMTTNFTEVYNAVLRGARALPLVGIIEFFLYRTMKYFLDCGTTAHAAMQYCQKVYSTWMTEYLTKIAHRAYPQPLRRDPGAEVQWKYQISCQSKSQKANGEITIQKNSYWESYMLMLLPQVTAATLPLLTCDHCMPCNKE
jgi:hypothetical protein